MREIFYCFIFIIFSLPILAQETLSPAELKEDFAQFKKQLYKRDKGLFLFVSEEAYENHLDSIASLLNTDKSPLAFYELLNKAIIPVEERHLSIQGFHRKSDTYKALNSKKEATQKIFPLLVYFENDSVAYTLRNAQRDSTIQLPSRLLKINNSSIKDIRDTLAENITQDHGVNSWRNWEISRSFAVKYNYLIDTTSQFVIHWRDSSNQIMKTEIEGVKRKAYTDSINKQSKAIFGIDEFKPPIRYKNYDSLKTGYLKIGSFSKKKVKHEGETIKYKKTVDDFFESVAKNNYTNIIIDLRNNTGGRVSLLKHLLAYIQTNEDKEAMYNQLKNRDYWWGEVTRERKTTKQKDPHFDGQVYILTNGGSYSASVMFAVYAKKMADAMIIGQPAGGRPTGTSAGSFHIERLKHSDILVRIPETVFTYADESEISIAPDVYVKPRVSDFFDYDADYQLETALEYISNGGR